VKRLITRIVFGILGVGVLVGWYAIDGFKPVVMRVIDGDTIELKDGRRVRYLGIDTPEEGECFYEESTKMNEELVLGKKVELKFDIDSMDDYGRMLAYVYVDGQMVNKLLLEKGAGRYYFDEQTQKFSQELVEAAEQAHEQKQGLWEVCGGEEGCVIKGNLDKSDKRWYHLSSFRHYEQTVVNLNKGDRWFCSEEEAQRAGFERARE